jgi:hypothetical protein
LPPFAGWKFFLEILDPPGDRLMADTEKTLKSIYTIAFVSILAERHDDKNYAKPVNPASHENTRWRQSPATATVAPTAKALANQKILGYSPGFPGIIALMEMTTAKGTIFPLMLFAKIGVNALKKV